MSTEKDSEEDDGDELSGRVIGGQLNLCQFHCGIIWWGENLILRTDVSDRPDLELGDFRMTENKIFQMLERGESIIEGEKSAVVKWGAEPLAEQELIRRISATKTQRV
jgi:hypothetical protein